MSKAGVKPLFAGVFFCLAVAVFSQEIIPAGGVWFSRSFERGMELYQEGRWLEAAAELRAAQETAMNAHQWTEALYWVILTELAISDYGSALRDMDALEKAAPGSGRNADMAYHRARAYYYLGYFEDALMLFKQYADNAGTGGESRKAAAIYWMGECLYSMGQLEKAEGFFNWIIENYPASSKYEASVYRLDLIKQKKIEVELLALLKWSHEESLRTSEEFQRKEKNYEQAMNAYQRRIADLLKDSRVADLESANTEYQKQLAEAQEKIRVLEARLGSSGGGDELKVRAQQLRNEAQWDLQNLENSGGGGR
jgi:TolA-binding protein